MARLLPRCLSNRPARAMTLHGQGDAGDNMAQTRAAGPPERAISSTLTRHSLAAGAHRRRSIREFGTVGCRPGPARLGGRLCRPQYWAQNSKDPVGVFSVGALVAISEGTVY